MTKKILDFKRFTLLLFICMCVLELELDICESPHEGAWNQTQVRCEASNCS